MGMLEEVKLDIKETVKYLVKLLKQVRRKKIMLYSFFLALISGLFIFYVSKNITLVDLIFIFSSSICLYNIFYPIYSKIADCFKRNN